MEIILYWIVGVPGELVMKAFGYQAMIIYPLSFVSPLLAEKGLIKENKLSSKKAIIIALLSLTAAFGVAGIRELARTML